MPADRSLRACVFLLFALLAACGLPGGGPRPALDENLRQLLVEAEAARARGDEARAEALLEQALRMAPREPRVWYRHAGLRLQQGRLDEARAMARRGLGYAREGRMRSQLWLLLAEIERRAGNPRAEQAALREAGVR